MRLKIIISILLFSIFSLIPGAYARENSLYSGTLAYKSGDYAGAIREFAKAGAKGQYIVGLFYYNGSGVRQDLQQAAFWLHKSAVQGHPGASYLLGVINEEGKGVRKDDKKAVKCYRKAAESGNADAESRLGFMYKDGRGIAKDSKEAVKWFRKAAVCGRVEAQYALGIMLENGYGVKRDTAEAAKWFRIAASQSLPSADDIEKQLVSRKYAAQ